MEFSLKRLKVGCQKTSIPAPTTLVIVGDPLAASNTLGCVEARLTANSGLPSTAAHESRTQSPPHTTIQPKDSEKKSRPKPCTRRANYVSSYPRKEMSAALPYLSQECRRSKTSRFRLSCFPSTQTVAWGSDSGSSRSNSFSSSSLLDSSSGSGRLLESPAFLHSNNRLTARFPYWVGWFSNRRNYLM